MQLKIPGMMQLSQIILLDFSVSLDAFVVANFRILFLFSLSFAFYVVSTFDLISFYMLVFRLRINLAFIFSHFQFLSSILCF